VNAQRTDRVDHVGPRTSWYDALFAFFMPSDDHVSDEDVFEIVTAKSDGTPAAVLCAAKGITVPMYCVWRTKYRQLTLDELRAVRQRARQRAMFLCWGVIASAALGTGGLVLGVAQAAYAAITVSDESPSAVPVPDPSLPVAKSESGHFGQAVNIPPKPGNALAPASAPPAARRTRADAPRQIAEPGYKIQVAAPQTLQEGLAMVDQLASAGYPAYLTRAIVGDAEVFRVRIGPFDTLSAAEEITARLKRDGYDGAWIAR
jgi:cell division septation protein DedD